MDISQTTEPRSDQQNFDDYIAGPKVVTITEVRAGTTEQPVEIHLAEFPGRPYKPSKTQRRVLVAAWGSDSSVYIGRRMELYGDPDVKFGGVAMGGIKIGKLSDITARLTLSLTSTRGKRAPHTVEPLIESGPTEADVAQSTDPAELRAWWKPNPGLRKAIEARVAELNTPEPDPVATSPEPDELFDTEES